MNNIGKIDEIHCFSCRSCEQICPQKCIKMQETQEGFLYPIVNESCIECGICIKHCPSLTPTILDWIKPKRYAAILKEKSILSKSSSGGLFGGIAQYILKNNGIVFGAVYDENMYVYHIGINNLNDLYKIQGSKYVVSDTKHVYTEIKCYLDSGRKVLYGATPCQIAGLHSFLAKSYENLYTMDLICHGVPSAKLFSRYLDYLGKKYKGKIIYYGFRDKEISGWICGGKTIIKTKSKIKIFEGVCDPYYSSFLRCETYRESCYVCPFAKQNNRVGDITMGDFWGTDKQYPQIPKENGISICSINTEKGKKLFKEVENIFELFEFPENENLTLNIAYNKPSKRPAIRNHIYEGVDSELKNYFKKFKHESPFRLFFKRIPQKIIPKCIKRILKVLLNKWKS